MSPAARRRRKRWSTESCNCRRRSAGREPSSVADATNLQALGAAIAEAAGPAVQEVFVERGAELVLRTGRDTLVPLMLLLRDDPRFAFEQVMDICGVDWPERAERFEVVYNLLSLSLNRRLRVLVATDEQTPVPSLIGVWPAATWYEREAWDMYGIVFAGQTDLRRLLTDYGFEGHPLRKDFPLTGHVQVRYDESRKQVVNEPVTLTQDFRSFDFLSPWEGMTTLPGDEKVHQIRSERGQIEGPQS
ncbi:NADH-quinone oxidoreductase subunit C [Roseomonas sp. BU-1]|uniref:NADH-quinone oxidoreductase subunit C n=1 Tax=Falsiroseomonas selenitidurans TaxID=2716335 RepID=A0ABX1E6E8_9PROT|nr:NADH-quinone oxidoreductase subunit C [Falsiroseomonas selenitidurans]